jgi:hypothetical protein
MTLDFYKLSDLYTDWYTRDGREINTRAVLISAQNLQVDGMHDYMASAIANRAVYYVMLHSGLPDSPCTIHIYRT